VVQNPARRGPVAGDLRVRRVDVTVERPTLERERVEDVLRRVVQGQEGAIERDGSTQSDGNSVEEGFSGEVRDDRVGDLE